MMRSNMNKQMSGKMKEKMMKKDKMGYVEGGRVKKKKSSSKARGCGMAKRGVKKAKMY